MAYTITPLTPHTGAEVTGLDLAKPVDAETRGALNRAWARHHVLVIRDQKYEPADFIHAEGTRLVDGHDRAVFMQNRNPLAGRKFDEVRLGLAHPF